MDRSDVVAFGDFNVCTCKNILNGLEVVYFGSGKENSTQ